MTSKDRSSDATFVGERSETSDPNNKRWEDASAALYAPIPVPVPEVLPGELSTRSTSNSSNKTAEPRTEEHENVITERTQITILADADADIAGDADGEATDEVDVARAKVSGAWWMEQVVLSGDCEPPFAQEALAVEGGPKQPDDPEALKTTDEVRTAEFLRSHELPTREPEAIEPEAIEPEAIEPEAIEPEAIEPEAIEPEAIEPEAIEPEAIEPEAIEPEAIEPEAIEPEAIEPEAIEPEAVEPEAIEPEAIEPEAIEPEAIEPEAIEPEAIELQAEVVPFSYAKILSEDLVFEDGPLNSEPRTTVNPLVSTGDLVDRNPQAVGVLESAREVARVESPAPIHIDVLSSRPSKRRADERELPGSVELGLLSNAREIGAKSEVVLGIDLGTTYSCAAVVADGRGLVLPSRWGSNTVPSAVHFTPSGKVLVGEAAIRQLASHPERTIVGAKRLVGRPFYSSVVQLVKEHVAYQVVPGESGEAAVEVDHRSISLSQVLALVLKDLRETATAQLGQRVNRAVIACPAHFNERQRDAIRLAGHLAGFHVERILSEPTAAALNYGFGRSQERRRVLVYDLGGGTFDVSVLEIRGDVYHVVATGGDSFLGGLDFDACIAGLLVDHFIANERIDPREDELAIARLMQVAEHTKRAISEQTEVQVDVDHFVVRGWAARPLRRLVTRSEAEELFLPLVEQTLRIAADVLKRAGLGHQDIDDLALVGGQTRAPIVHRMVREFFGREPQRSVHPDESVSLGAAAFGATLGQVDSVILIERLPMSIGVGLPGGQFRRVIERDVSLPALRTYVVQTTHDGQRELEVVLFQGEDDDVRNDEALGVLTIPDLLPGPRGSVSVEISFELTGECVLELRALEQPTRRALRCRFSTSHSPEEIREKLSLPPHPSRAELMRQRAMIGRQGLPDRPKGSWAWLNGFFRRR